MKKLKLVFLRSLMILVASVALGGCSVLQPILGESYEFTDADDYPLAASQSIRHCIIQPCANYY